ILEHDEDERGGDERDEGRREARDGADVAPEPAQAPVFLRRSVRALLRQRFLVALIRLPPPFGALELFLDFPAQARGAGEKEVERLALRRALGHGSRFLRDEAPSLAELAPGHVTTAVRLKRRAAVGTGQEQRRALAVLLGVQPSDAVLAGEHTNVASVVVRG